MRELYKRKKSDFCQKEAGETYNVRKHSEMKLILSKVDKIYLWMGRLDNAKHVKNSV